MDGLVIFRPAVPLASTGGAENPDIKTGVVPESMVWPGRKKKESTSGFSIQEFTCIVRVQGSPVRALVDTGASVSLIRTDAYDRVRIGGMM